MTQFTYTIQDPNGIHARPAGLLVKAAQGFSSSIRLAKGEKAADLKRLFALMGLNVKQGDTVTLTAEGPDEAQAVSALEAFFRENL